MGVWHEEEWDTTDLYLQSLHHMDFLGMETLDQPRHQQTWKFVSNLIS